MKEKPALESARLGYPNLGFGVGLRSAHFDHIINNHPAVEWFEIISENFIDSRGWPRRVLDLIAERYPIVMHGVSLSIGSSDALDFDYLCKIKRLAQEIEPVWVSDHLCWTGVLGRNTHDLLPIPLNEDTLQHVVERIKVVQEFLERPLVLENPSSYVRFAMNTLSEWEFLAAMSAETGCGLLLDVSNVYVSSFNHGFDAVEYISAVPADRIVQFHLAGHTHHGTHILDTHDRGVTDHVWELYRTAYGRTSGVSTLLEWDSKIPEFAVLQAELERARRHAGTSQSGSGSEVAAHAHSSGAEQAHALNAAPDGV